MVFAALIFAEAGVNAFNLHVGSIWAFKKIT